MLCEGRVCEFGSILMLLIGCFDGMVAFTCLLVCLFIQLGLLVSVHFLLKGVNAVGCSERAQWLCNDVSIKMNEFADLQVFTKVNKA